MVGEEEEGMIRRVTGAAGIGLRPSGTAGGLGQLQGRVLLPGPSF